MDACPVTARSPPQPAPGRECHAEPTTELKAVEWTLDTSKCHVCETRFNLFFHRQFCHQCHEACCYSCSKDRKVIRAHHQPQPVCKECVRKFWSPKPDPVVTEASVPAPVDMPENTAKVSLVITAPEATKDNNGPSIAPITPMTALLSPATPASILSPAMVSKALRRDAFFSEREGEGDKTFTSAEKERGEDRNENNETRASATTAVVPEAEDKGGEETGENAVISPSAPPLPLGLPPLMIGRYSSQTTPASTPGTGDSFFSDEEVEEGVIGGGTTDAGAWSGATGLPTDHKGLGWGQANPDETVRQGQGQGKVSNDSANEEAMAAVAAWEALWSSVKWADDEDEEDEDIVRNAPPLCRSSVISRGTFICSGKLETVHEEDEEEDEEAAAEAEAQAQVQAPLLLKQKEEDVAAVVAAAVHTNKAAFRRDKDKNGSTGGSTALKTVTFSLPPVVMEDTTNEEPSAQPLACSPPPRRSHRRQHTSVIHSIMESELKLPPHPDTVDNDMPDGIQPAPFLLPGPRRSHRRQQTSVIHSIMESELALPPPSPCSSAGDEGSSEEEQERKKSRRPPPHPRAATGTKNWQQEFFAMEEEVSLGISKDHATTVHVPTVNVDRTKGQGGTETTTTAGAGAEEEQVHSQLPPHPACDEAWGRKVEDARPVVKKFLGAGGDLSHLLTFAVGTLTGGVLVALSLWASSSNPSCARP
ncbi:unnamed protein product [Discosporangium mesarthrocarpum]